MTAGIAVEAETASIAVVYETSLQGADAGAARVGRCGPVEGETPWSSRVMGRLSHAERADWISEWGPSVRVWGFCLAVGELSKPKELKKLRVGGSAGYAMTACTGGRKLSFFRSRSSSERIHRFSL